MEYWAKPPLGREQMVLFPSRLDEAVEARHPVRVVDAILARVEWAKWEAGYNLKRGQPPIHPRVLVGVLLYGLLTRVRSSRALEDALRVRLDFRWLAEGRIIDHTTLSEFRKKHPDELKDLFVQIGLIARELGHLSLEQLAFDGTRLRANSRRSGTRRVDDLQKCRDELAAKFAELLAKADAHDAHDDEAERLVGQVADQSQPGQQGDSDQPYDPAEIARQVAEVKRRLAEVDAALAEIARVKAAGETVPKYISLTDPESRVSPNKEGGFAPNYTPLAMVDVASGLVVAVDVSAMTNEEAHLVPQLNAVQADFALEHPVREVMADTMSTTGANLHALNELGVTLFSPSKLPDPTTNPACRDEPSQPVPPEQWDKLPTQTTQHKNGKTTTLLTKDAFVHDATRDCYWCPNGQALAFRSESVAQLVGGPQTRRRYSTEVEACASCPLRAKCLSAKAKRREVSRFQHDHLVTAHSKHMATPAAQAQYKRRGPAGERPFAHCKHHFGARQFLLRGLDKVRIEWRWLMTAFNIRRLITLLQPRPGPKPNPQPATP